MRKTDNINNEIDKTDSLISKEQRLQKLLSGLGNDYTIILLINLDTDKFEIVLNQQSNNIAKQHKTVDYTDYLDNYANAFVVPESCEDMKRILRRNNLLEYFKNHNDLYFRFRSVPNSLGQTCFEAHAVREYDNQNHCAVIGFRCVDRIVAKELEYQRELDKAYRLARQQLDVITASLPGGLKISYDDPMYSFKYVSKQYAAMLGYTVDELMEVSGGTIAGIAHPDDLEAGISEALRQYETKDNYAITYRMRCKDGTYKYIEDHGHKVINSEGVVEHWNLILDKDELVNKTIELESARKAEEAKTAFLSRMSHDIRTPLNGIIGLLEYAIRHPEDIETIRKNRKKAQIAANHLLSLVNDILELNKLDEKHVTLFHEAFDLGELLQEVKTITEMRAAEHGITVHTDESVLNLNNRFVYGSPLHVKQVLINVISNSIKYNKAGGSVWCKLKEETTPDGQVCFKFAIIDSGIGMNDAFLKNIFDPFVQAAQGGARTVYNGSGLGMAIVKGLVDRMGGSISVKSTLDVGTSVEITLLFDKAEPEEVPQKPEFTPESTDLSHINALVVEDNSLNMQIAKYILKEAKINVTEAHDGLDAINVFSKSAPGSFDIILMDIMMPVMDGLTATRTIRALPRADAQSIPIFAMTANAFAEDVERAKEAGMNEHLAKPLNIQQVLGKIAQYCAK